MTDPRAVLARHPLFAVADPEVRALVEHALVREEWSFGEVIAREGDAAGALWIVVTGSVRLVRAGPDGREVALGRLGPGESFGVDDLGGAGPLSSTARATAPTVTLRLDRVVLEALGRQEPAVAQLLRQQHRNRHLQAFLRLYTPLAQLPAAQLAALLDALEERVVPAGTEVLRAGDLPGPFFLVESGRLRAWREVDGQRQYVSYFRAGDSFPERALRAQVFVSPMDIDGDGDLDVTVESDTECRLLVVQKALLEQLLHSDTRLSEAMEATFRRRDYRRAARVPLDFADTLPAEARVGANRAEESFSPGEAQAGRQELRSFPFLSQIDEMDCGAACLGMICRHFGRAVSLTRIREMVQVSTDGTRLSAIVRAAQDLGLAARSVKASRSQVDAMPLPAVIHWEGNHWVVLWRVRADRVWIADPAGGIRDLPRAELDQKWTGYAALFEYTLRFEQAPVTKASFSFFLPYLRPHLGVFAQAVGLGVVMAALATVLPVCTQLIVDRVFVERDMGLLHVVLGVMGVTIAASVITMILQRYLLSWVALRVDAAALDALTARLLDLPLSWFGARRTGDIQRRLGNMRQIRAFLVGSGLGLITAAIQLCVSVGLMALYSLPLLLAWAVTVPMYVGLMRVSALWLRPLFERLEDAQGRYQSRQIDAIRGMEAVKAAAAEGRVRNQLIAEFTGMAHQQFRADFTAMSYGGAVQTVSFVSHALFLYVGAGQVLDGRLTVGGLMAFSALVEMANGPVSRFLSLWDQYQQHGIMLDRLQDVFEAKPEQDRASLVPVRSLAGRVQLRNLCLRFGGPESPLVLHDICLDIPAGTTVAIVGRSGSGKTTLVRCLTGMLEPTSGAVLLDGVDVRTVDWRQLRRRVGYVLQKSYLFDDTIARNIALSDEEPDMDRVIQAARIANASGFVERLPLGYEARVGESGLALSGGQAQRIAIARALYPDPALLVLDEATSALDTESERAIQENLREILRGRTSFIIAHRLSTVREADLIVVLDEGRVVEQGTHADLLARGGLYHHLANQQLHQ